MNTDKIKKSKAKSIGTMLEMKFYNIITNLVWIGNRLASHSFLTDKVITINYNMLVAIKDQVADVYTVEDSDNGENKYITYNTTKRNFGSVYELIVDLCEEYDLSNENYGNLSLINAKTDVDEYEVLRVEGQDFKEEGITKEDTSGYMIQLNEDLYFIADNGEQADKDHTIDIGHLYIDEVDNMEECIVEMENYSFLTNYDNSTSATREKMRSCNITLSVDKYEQAGRYPAIWIPGKNYVLTPFGDKIEIDKNLISTDTEVEIKATFDLDDKLRSTRITYSPFTYF